MKITRDTVIKWILGLTFLAIAAAQGWRMWQELRENCRMCYLPTNELPKQSMDHSSLTRKYHDLGVMSDSAFEKISEIRHGA